MKGKVQKSVMFVEDEAKSVALDSTGPHRNVSVGTSVHFTSAGTRDVGYTNPEEAPQR